jgi:hypothetical protein
MSFVFINLAVRFVLEMIAFAAFGMWGWDNTEGWTRYVAAIALPVLASTIWGVFNVPGDPSRSGNAPVVVPGVVRLIIEACFFTAGAWALMSLGYTTHGRTFIVVVILHYLGSFNRITWLLSRKARDPNS